VPRRRGAGGVPMGRKEMLDEAKNLLMHGERKKSIDLFTSAIDSGEKTAISYLSRGVAHLQLGNFQPALDDFTKAIELNAANPRAHFYRGIVHMVSKRYLMAVHDFTRTLEVEPQHGLAYAARGSCYLEMGLEDEAAVDLKAALVQAQISGQRFVDSMGLVRTQLDRAFHLWIGEARDPRLTREEYEQLRNLMEVGWKDE